MRTHSHVTPRALLVAIPHRRAILAAFVSLILAAPAFAQICPLVHDLIDANCDGGIKLAFTGDSIVYGVGDSREQGGFVGRVASRRPELTVTNIGVPGITSARLLRDLKQNLRKEEAGTTQIKMDHSDIIFVHVGVNDYWEDRPAAYTTNKIKRIRKFLLRHYRHEDGTTPYIVFSKLLNTDRSFQQPFVDQVNSRLSVMQQNGFPIYLDFSRLRTTLLTEDGLHPSSRGYNRMTRIVLRFLSRRSTRVLTR